MTPNPTEGATGPLDERTIRQWERVKTYSGDDPWDKNYWMFRRKPLGSHLLAYSELESISCKLPWFGDVLPNALPLCLHARKVELGQVQTR